MNKVYIVSFSDVFICTLIALVVSNLRTFFF